MEVSAPATLETPAGTISFDSDGDVYVKTKFDGFDDAEQRLTVDNKSREDGAVVHSAYDAAIHGSIEGWIIVTDPAFRNELEDALVAAVRSLNGADGTLTVTPTGQSSRFLTVRKDGAIQTAVVSGTLHSFQFGLVAVDPFWA